MFHHYRRLIELRHTLSVVVEGDFRLLLADDPRVFAYVRTLGETRLLVVANLSGESATVDLADDDGLSAGTLLLATHEDGRPAQGTTVELQPWESRVLLTG